MDTILISAVVGFVTFLVGQIVVKFLIEPAAACRKLIAEVGYALIMYAPQISNPGLVEKEVMDDASEKLRLLASQLPAQILAIPYYETVTRKIFRLPMARDMREASSLLIGLSNSLFREDDRVHENNGKRVDRIHDLLGLYHPAESRWPANS